jgi:hypothetical protein
MGDSEEGTAGRIGPALRWIQVAVVAAGVTLLVVHTFAAQWRVDDKALTVDAVSIGLVAVVAAGLLLARIEKIKWGDTEITLARKIRKGFKTLEDAGATVQDLGTDDLRAALDDPAGVVLKVRDDIVEHLAQAAERAGVAKGQRLTAAEAVRRLRDSGKLDSARATGVLDVVRAVQQARLVGVDAARAADLRKLSYLVVEIADGIVPRDE